MRQIMSEAGASNKSAIAYHFGDRESLVRAIWKNRLPELEADRARMLDDLVARGGQNDPEAIFRVLVIPSYRPVDEDGRHRYAAFLRQTWRWQPGIALRQSVMAETPSSASAVDILRGLFPQLPDALYTWRSRAAHSLFFDLVHERDCDVALGLPVMDEDAFLAETVRMSIACLSAPIACDPAGLPPMSGYPFAHQPEG